MTEPALPEEKDSKSFWNTLLGTITKITSLLIAITGLLLAVGPSLKGCNENKNLNSGKQDLIEKPVVEKSEAEKKRVEAEKKINTGGSSADR